MAQIRLAKALRIKNKLAGEIAELGRRLQGYNSYREENVPPFKADDVWAERQALVIKLTNLKAKISAANVPIQWAIFKLAELKSAVALVKEISTKAGVTSDPYGDDNTYVVKVQWDAVKVAAIVKGTSAQIEEMQDLIEAHNASITIEFDV